MKKRIVVGVVLAFVLVLISSCAPTTAQTKKLFDLLESGTPQDVQAAISKGADVKAHDSYYGATPLMGAISYDQKPEVIATLLKAGSDVNAQDNEGRTPLMDAALYNHHPEVITMLLAAGADAKAKSHEGKTAFNYAQDTFQLKGTDAFKQLEEASK